MTGTVVITGGNGFVGQHLSAELTAQWPEATVVGFDLPDVDITKLETYQQKIAELQPDWLVHLAALAAVGAALDDPQRALAVNAEGTRTLLAQLQEDSPDTKTLVASSADIYGAAVTKYGDQPIPELSLQQCQPQNPYAESKRAMEQLIEESFADQVLRVRPFPHIGPGQQRGFVTADFAWQIAAIEAGQQPPTLTVGNLAAARDFTDVRDVVRAYRLLMEYGQLGEVYNVASGQPTSIQQLLDQLLAVSSADITVEQDPDKLRPSDIPVFTGDASTLQEATLWQPTISLDQSLSDILDYWRQKQ